jgi:hypothetical protein
LYRPGADNFQLEHLKMIIIEKLKHFWKTYIAWDNQPYRPSKKDIERLKKEKAIASKQKDFKPVEMDETDSLGSMLTSRLKKIPDVFTDD